MSEPWTRREVIGDAVLYLGDCREVLPHVGKVDAIITDPPYSSGGMYRSDRTASTDNKYHISHETTRTYAAFSGDNRDQRSFQLWCERWMALALEISGEGGVFGCFIDWRNLCAVVDAMQIAGWVYRGITPWHKGTDQRPVKGWFRRNIEFIVWGSCGPLKTGHLADGECIDGMFFHRVNGAEKVHQTGKPLELMEDVLRVRTEWQVILDPFMGSGTTGMACARLSKRFIGVELDPGSFETACRRIDEAQRQGRLFDAPRPKPEQASFLP